LLITLLSMPSSEAIVPNHFSNSLFAAFYTNYSILVNYLNWQNDLIVPPFISLAFLTTITLVLSWEILERVMLLERFVGVFRQCKQSLGNKGLQLSSRNNKSRLKISWTRSIRESRSKAIYFSIIWGPRCPRCSRPWSPWSPWFEIQDAQGPSHLDHLDLVDRSSLPIYLVKSDARRIVPISTRLVTLSPLSKGFRPETIYSSLSC